MSADSTQLGTIDVDILPIRTGVPWLIFKKTIELFYATLSFLLEGKLQSRLG